MKAERAWLVVLSILVFLVVLLGSFRALVFNHAYYLEELSRSNVYGFEESFLSEVAAAAIGYLGSQDAGLSSYFGGQEMSHMSDVKRKIGFFILLFYAAGLAAIGSLILVWQGKIPAMVAVRSVAWGSGAVLALAAALFLVSSYFSGLFTLFHLVAFPEGNWMFPESSVMVRVFNEKFFYSFLYRIVLNSALAAAFLLAASLALLHMKTPLRRKEGLMQ